jgi:hypothetical protein
MPGCVRTYVWTQAVLRRVLRFVSLVPPTPEWTTYRRRYDVWLTAEETLKYCMGDHEELAVLLCNFFLHLGVDASVVLGPCARAARRDGVSRLSGCGC